VGFSVGSIWLMGSLRMYILFGAEDTINPRGMLGLGSVRVVHRGYCDQ